jgi:hypothetical protein
MAQHLNEVNMNLNTEKYFIIRNFLDKDFAKFIESYFYTRIKSGAADSGDMQAPHSYSLYGDPLMDTILANSIQGIEKVTGMNLLPTYTYTRLYGKGDELKIHRDRPSCELSATLAIAVPEGEEINPIYFSKTENKEDAVKILLEPGDLCIYYGCDLWHWRDPFEQKWYLQSFLHYVRTNGQYANNIFDGRKYLGAPRLKTENTIDNQ